MQRVSLAARHSRSNAAPFDVRAFISHSWQDKLTARAIADALEAEGIKVWLDERQITVGDSIWDEVGSGIDASDYLTILLSTQSASSAWVRRELNVALAAEIDSARKIVLPVLIERTELPTFLRERLYCDLTAGFDEGIAALLRAMKIN